MARSSAEWNSEQRYWYFGLGKIYEKKRKILWDALCDLVPFVQSKKREKHRWKRATFSKVRLLHGCFSRFLDCINGTKIPQNITMSQAIYLKLSMCWAFITLLLQICSFTEKVREKQLLLIEIRFVILRISSPIMLFFTNNCRHKFNLKHS